jgi:type IV pilus assembly protein PilB
MVTFDEDKQNQRLVDFKRKEEEDVAQILSEKYGLDYVDLSKIGINNDALRLLNETDSRTGKIGIFNIVDKNLSVAVAAPNNPNTVEALKKLEERGYKTKSYMVSEQSLEKVWSRFKDLSYAMESKNGALDISNDEIVNFLNKVKSIEDIKKLIEDTLGLKKVHRISGVMEIMIAGALAIDASDIHLEPEESYVQLRFRLDGVLTEVLRFDTDTYNLMLSRIKLVSNMKLNLTGAQDGRFSVKIRDEEIEIRTSVLPGAYDESIVMRILNPKTISVPMEALGMEQRLLDIVNKEIAKPNGMILTTGPTGSGKTTTLYAFLKKARDPGIKIITIENPIEYHLPGIVQTQTDEKKNYTFLEGLRAAVRQDPDIIMVGEIRDNESADIAVNSALTGHLVFSTLHTNNAAGTYPRLIDLGVNPKVLTSAITIALAQRLVRKLCATCRKEVPLEGAEKETVNRVLSTIHTVDKIPQSEKCFVPVGCPACNNTGFKGRIGIFEAILTDAAIEEAVNNNPSEREIKKAALPQGMLDMLQDGIIKMLQGVTSIDELRRVIDIDAVS